MALRGCFGCLKYMVLIMNLIFWLAGIAVLAFSMWLLFDSALYLKVTDHGDKYLQGTYVLLAVGGLMTLVGFLGCCGAFRESQCMLASYFMFVLVILVAQIAIAAWGYANRAQLNKLIQDGVKDTVKKTYNKDQARTAAFNEIQQAFHCCGADGPSDWASSVYNNADEKSFFDIGITGLVKSFRVPKSCCKAPMDSTECEAATQASILGQLTGSIYTEGCSDKLINTLEKNSSYVIWVVIALGLVELIGMICSLLLCCAVRRIDDFKA